jgi:hypothetical protein
VLDGSSLISTTSPEPGLVLVGRSQGYTHSEPTADAIVSFTLNRRKAAALESVNTADAASRRLVSQLIAQHAEFEAGRPLDLTELQQTATDLLATATAVADAKGKQ